MGKWLVLLLVTVTATAQAQPADLSPAERVRMAAHRGDCKLARELASLLRETDAGSYAALSRDPAFAACSVGPRREPAEGPSKEIDVPTSIVLETVLGTGVGFSGLLAGGLLGYAATSGNVLVLYGPGIGALVGWTLVAPIGVYLAGNAADYHGSKAATELGAIAGGVGGLLLAEHTGNQKLQITALLGTPLVGAVLGYNLTRSNKRDHALAIAPVLDVSHDRTVAGLGGRF